ncbi:hypothetical protein N7448_004714 [Penicillium atrosanguineum]|uniref:Ubiquinone biosynthesis protein n=1 Tax=Penicillium atrosanguineum TaxID=1132637 RepID=A0A9W9H2A1_9EURO|nr:uncharacterized protein N7443_008462 [Penicillium atrosanguineum]KAJ5136160.1 hypothetical protein N7448_004714 [Penicillium atrosanguineum]KAJ5292509.1 hypothetical protein N7443_008462 [Penicillium atrosanguineum]KAJ5303467.1 hypothetical protein N7476_010266 [Penicillium atrosanguineum]
MASLRMPRRALPSLKSVRTPSSISTSTFTSTHLRPSVPSQSRSQPPQIRPYHSTLHPRLPDHTYNNSQTAILTASLPHIPTHGFSAESLALGARDAGFLDVSVQLFPRAEFDLILFWLASRRGLLRAKVEEGALFRRVADQAGRDVSSLDVEEKCRILVMERLKMNEDVKGQWSGALAQMSLLGNITLSLSELHALSNDILSLAGDSAVDASWYSRRFGLSAIYASAEMVMTRDPTPDLSETETFVNRRFEDKLALNQKIEGLSQCVSFVGNTAVGVGRSWGLKI